MKKDTRINNDDVYFALDEHVELDVYSAGALKEQSTHIYVDPYIILNPIQLAFATTTCLSSKYQIPVLTSLSYQKVTFPLTIL
jgi:hypothetical protein